MKRARLSREQKLMRDHLFGDLPLEEAARALVLFREPLADLAAREEARAASSLQWIAESAEESRVRLIAWRALRELGKRPLPGREGRILGAVLEIPVTGGLDILAAYADHRARFWSGRGGGIIWEAPEKDPVIDGAIDGFLCCGRELLPACERVPGEGHPAPPLIDRVRLSILLPEGLHLKEGAWNVREQDAVFFALIGSAAELHRGLLDAVERRRAASPRA